ncbi:MAG: hypothetical protein COA79_00035 [Planctomycetota bacterium]|nr:MAG: hypothetical protein COA79_00035 [Planctomycetota bacterium]
MKTVISIFIMYLIFINCHTQDKSKKIPNFLIKNQFLTKESHRMIRWINFDQKQRKLIFPWYMDIAKKSISTIQKKNLEHQLKLKDLKDRSEIKKLNDLYTEEINKIRSETKKAVLDILKEIASTDQINSYKNKVTEANNLKKELADNLKIYHEEKIKLGALKENLIGLQATLKKGQCLYYPEIWALTRTPLSKQEINNVYKWVGKNNQYEQGFYLGIDSNSSQLGKNDGSYFYIYLKKDFGTKDFITKAPSILSSKNLKTYVNLLKLYKNQKTELLRIYSKYSEIVKIQFDMTPPKILEIKQ